MDATPGKVVEMDEGKYVVGEERRTRNKAESTQNGRERE